HCCGDEEGFVSKMRHACSCLQTGERVVFIDDAARYYENTLWKIAKEDRDFIYGFAERLSAIEFGQERAVPCDYLYPVMPISSMSRWELVDDRVATMTPYFGRKPATFYTFFREDFEPVALRRRPNPKIPPDAFEQAMRR